MKISINVDNEFTGNILNDLNQRRAKVLSIDEKPEGQQEITALVPEAEIQDYVSKLRVLTHGPKPRKLTGISQEVAKIDNSRTSVPLKSISIILTVNPPIIPTLSI